MKSLHFLPVAAAAVLFAAVGPTACSSDSAGSGGGGDTSPSSGGGTPGSTTSTGHHTSSTTSTAPTIECQNDVDCGGGATCGGDVCSWADTPNKICVPASGGDPGWCSSDTDCKCAAEGATCSGVHCTSTTPGGAGGGGGAGGSASGGGGAGGGTGGGAGTGGAGGGGCSGAELTVKNFDSWCTVTVNGHPLTTASVCVDASSTVDLVAEGAGSFILGPKMWHHTNGDTATPPTGEDGTQASGKSSAKETVGAAGTTDCVWVCCPFPNGTGCDVPDQCP